MLPISFRSTLKYVYLFEPWRYEKLAESLRGELRFRRSFLWTEVVVRRGREKAWGVLCVVPTVWWDRIDSCVYEDVLMSYLDSVASSGASDHPSRPVQDKVFQEAHPALFEFLTATMWSDGQVRTPSCLTLFAEDGAFKLCLAERDRGLTLWATAAGFADALKQLEDRLKSDRPDWRKNRPKPQGRASK